ncbi:hypothetical protein [Labrenzia sp. 011]|uniref:VHL beta domain-containing protein n=1 Tax=Labrenzia sp. 011 TaxID=2171494 RepID=UPI000D51FD14|nr:hypothetical protein [Labrenzia sp. 011]PVB61971.1 hypothetical protein DCO57_08750 [Labrenzia sp. 011]
MRHNAAHARFAPVLTSGLLAVCSLVLPFSGSIAHAQSVPETLRINVDPPEPGIRSITVNKKYRPIISRDGNGVVIDTMGSDSKLPPCEVKLEVTLENSRVLHRDADICSGNTLVVDVSSDGKPGAAARVVGTNSGTAAGPVSATPSETATRPRADTPSGRTPADGGESTITSIDPPDGSNGLEPLERVDTPISTPDQDGTDTARVSGELETLVRERLSGGGGGNAQPVMVTPRQDREWFAEPGLQPGTLTFLQHTVAQTDDRDFRAECTAQSGFARLMFQQAPAGLLEGMPQAVRISAGDFEATYNAFGSSALNEAGRSLPEVSIEMSDPLWEEMIRQTELSIAVEGMPAYAVSLRGSANPVRLFVATCSLPQQIVSDEAFGVPGQEAGSDLSCAELGRVRSLEAVRPGQIVFRNASRQPIEIHWIDYRGGERPYARLEPGQILEQQTYVSHAWSVRGANGECRGIYVTKTPYREVVINGPANFNPGGGNFNAPVSGPGGFPNAPQNNGFPTGPVPPADIRGAAQAPVGQLAARTNVADYLCTAGIDLNVVFSPDGQSATVAEMGYGAVTLQRAGSANTFYFESQGHILKGQLQNATWSRPGLRDVFCARR